MFIKYIILDGFKSYTRETILGPLDKQFNGIMGLDGTGKSTILDAICFVLEICSSSAVKDDAARLENLISKVKLDGDAVAKSANVSIVFDNTDKRLGKCPVGYSSCDEIVISRRIERRSGHNNETEILSEYHLNGATAQQNVLTDLLKWIRLDVERPNFMIRPRALMEVVSMEPKELLQMIQDGLGLTRLDQVRRKVLSVMENSTREINIAESDLKTVMLDELKAIKRGTEVGYDLYNIEDLQRMEKYIRTYLGKRRKVDKIIQRLDNVMSSLEDQMADSKRRAYENVNPNLGFMMRTLVEGSDAKLVPVSPNNIQDGVRIHVSLSAGVWKESLEELSGGQRSLVALALRLAILFYNPPPFYVLDEIDAGLDVNQISNLGRLLKERLRDVQLICVSEEEELYGKANVLFTTTMKDGASKISRVSLEMPKEPGK